ncbi:hypothetical protein F2P81_018501 [Scophthalmus maximus]|uniref:Uncharacterized protein n=1 Tax=Scophthalmus maximus TaxID=52904 RepID=A0A6A4S2F5_SCOMX|nr:hypothetical protein F2P81_018501 [Scophthalmus maximus]
MNGSVWFNYPTIFKSMCLGVRDTTLEAHVKANGPLTLSVSEVEEQTQDKQQRQQQQRGSGSVHGGTAWHQHALAASVALAHRALVVRRQCVDDLRRDGTRGNAHVERG